MSDCEFAETFDRTCRDRLSSPAVLSLSDGRVRTFADLREQARFILSALRRQRIGPGACVVSLVGNQPIFFPLMAACMEAGAALLPLGEANDIEAAAMIEKSGAAAVVTDRMLPIEFADSMPIDAGISLHRVCGTAAARPFPRSVLIKLTSGSTDLPKAAVASARAVLADGRHLIQGMGIGPEDLSLGLIPLSHAYAIGNIVAPLVLQGTRAALRPAFNPGMFLEDLEASEATVFPGVPFMFDRLRGILKDRELPGRLRLLVTAGAKIELDTMRWFHAHAGRKIHSLYGTSETGGITFDETDELADELHVGRPLPGVSIELLHEPGHTGGRVFVRSHSVADGYAGDTGVDAQAAFCDGGFRTSDVGRLDAQGRLVLSGRVSPLVNVAGRKVDPSEVERVLLTMRAIADARVIGVDSRLRGQELIAFVLPADPSITQIALRRSCAETLSPYKIPRRFIFLERWPVDERGKMDRRALDALASDA